MLNICNFQENKIFNFLTCVFVNKEIDEYKNDKESQSFMEKPTPFKMER